MSIIAFAGGFALGWLVFKRPALMDRILDWIKSTFAIGSTS